MSVCLMAIMAFPGQPRFVMAQPPKTAPSEAQQSIEKRLGGLRELPDAERARVTKQLALDIRRLPDAAMRLNMASALGNLSTEGDFGQDTLKEVAVTLAEALRAKPAEGTPEQPAYPYVTLAQLARYENIRVSLDDSQYTAALAKLEADDQQRQKADFTLTDLEGKSWTLKALRGKAVFVNFWATWCPPCRKELPDLEALYQKFRAKGFVVLGITDEEASKVQPFVAQNKMTYPVLLDTGRKTNKEFRVQSIPRSLLYDRNGKLVAQAIDMRTKKQLMAMLAHAGLR